MLHNLFIATLPYLFALVGLIFCVRVRPLQKRPRRTPDVVREFVGRLSWKLSK